MNSFLSSFFNSLSASLFRFFALIDDGRALLYLCMLLTNFVQFFLLLLLLLFELLPVCFLFFAQVFFQPFLGEVRLDWLRLRLFYGLHVVKFLRDLNLFHCVCILLFTTTDWLQHRLNWWRHDSIMFRRAPVRRPHRHFAAATAAAASTALRFGRCSWLVMRCLWAP